MTGQGRDLVQGLWKQMESEAEEAVTWGDLRKAYALYMGAHRERMLVDEAYQRNYTHDLNREQLADEAREEERRE